MSFFLTGSYSFCLGHTWVLLQGCTSIENYLFSNLMLLIYRVKKKKKTESIPVNTACSLWEEDASCRNAFPCLYLKTEHSVQYSCSVVSDSLRPHGLQHTRPPCPSLTPRVYSNSCSLSQWCHPTISSSVVPFSSCLQSFPASGSFQMSWFSTSGGQSIGVSASESVLPINTQDWSPLGWTGWISL